MAMIVSTSDSLQQKAAYHLVRRAQAGIAGYRHFEDGDLAKYMERTAFHDMAAKLADHYFHRSRGLAIYNQVQDIFIAHLIVAPIIQRLPLSYKYDWHRGHLLSWFRCKANGRVRQFHFGSRCIERSYLPDSAQHALDQVGIHDAVFVESLLDLYRRHAGGVTLKDKLANQLFDPALLAVLKNGNELRFGNRLFRLERNPFEGSIDLRYCWAKVLEFSIHSEEHNGGRHLKIILSDGMTAGFREQIKRILDLSSAPDYKLNLIMDRIRDFLELARWARSAEPQIKELRRWLNDKVRTLSGTLPEARNLGNLMLNLWYQRAEHRLFVKSPSFFFDPKEIDEKTFLVFFSPYREVSYE